MNILVIFAHYSDKSFCHQIYAQTLSWLQKQGHTVKSRHLYKMQFNPVLSSQDLEAIALGKPPAPDILKEQAYISWADCLIFVYPIWWWERPAILKGWFDRVFSRGFAFEYTPQGVQGKLGDKRALVIQSVGMPSTYPQMVEKGYLFKRSIADGSLRFCGITKCDILTLCGLYGFKLNHIGDHLRELETFLETKLR